MMTTLELPEKLVEAVRQRAQQEGRDVADFVANLLKANPAPGPVVGLGKDLPKIAGTPAPGNAGPPMSAQERCDWIKEMEVQLEVERYEASLRR